MVAVTYGVARIAAGKLRASTKPTVAKARGATADKGFFARFYDALLDSRLRQAQRELRLHRHLLTDDFD